MAIQRNKSTQAPKPKTQTSAKTTQAPKVKPQENLQDEKPKAVDKSKYDRYTSLKFLEIDLINSNNADPSKMKLPEHVKKELTDLETEIMKCEGVRPTITITAAIDHEVIKLVEGIPLPKEYSDIIFEKDKIKPNTAQLYFG